MASVKHVQDLDHLNRHECWMLFGIAGVITLGLIAYAVNLRGIAYKISANGMGPGHRAYRVRVAFNPVGAAFFAVIGGCLAAKGLRGALG
ncbi:hypothetical protein [Kitasatospora sp. DSM 101779]|uniref:hypothetical protein n=1 Tax=Kitasatospora sp. DSM 101779 TaxID=2853165 RepID=UPI0021DA9E04|nr:hypothetical protein [Kitasatospora sp. DSM 101779]MCU7820772.1 hypothetical protein [Kitasatospora sp. DSM 101779]